jgi:hypothetical protein
MLVSIPKINIRIKKFLFSLPIERRYIKYIISFIVSNLICLLHVHNIYLKGRMNDKHINRHAQGDVHSHLPLGQHLMLVKKFNWIELMLLENLNCPIKKHVICGMGSLLNLWTLKGIKNQSLINKLRIQIKWWKFWTFTSIVSLVGFMVKTSLTCPIKQSWEVSNN